MASKPDKREYYKKYNKKRNRKEYDAERFQKQKEEKELAKYREFKSQLEETKATNTWFDPNRNPYIFRLPSEETERYGNERKKRFLLQFDMDNLYSRKKEDSKVYEKRRQKAFSEFFAEKDLFYRIQYYRIFRRTFKERMNNMSPDRTNQMMNNCFIPEELNPESCFYRPDLLHLLEEGEDSDPPLKVLIPPEWAQKLIDEDSSDSWDSDFNGE